MDKDQSAVSKFLSETKNENLFELPKNEVFEEETQQEPEEVKEEKPLPFNRDPKIQKFIEKEINKRLEQVKSEVPRETSEKNEDEFKDVMDAMVKAIGNDTPEKVAALNAYQSALIKLDQRGASKAEQIIEEISQREAIADQEAEEELDNAFEAIEETYDVDFDRNPKLRSEFATFVERIAPKDRNGDIVDYPDMLSAFETFQEMKQSTRQPSRAKELASRGMARSAETSIKPEKRISWNTVDEYMDTLR